MSGKLSPEMLRAVSWARLSDGSIYRHPGGYWAAKDFVPNTGGAFFGTTTINALVQRGAGEYTEYKEGRSGRFPVKFTLKELS